MFRFVALMCTLAALAAAGTPDVSAQIGACCFIDSGCQLLEYWDCVRAPGSYAWVPEPSCDPNPCPLCICAACCLPNGACVITYVQDECESLSGQFFGFWVDCDPDPCAIPPGACCFENGDCVVLAEEDCLGAPEVCLWIPEAGCDPNPCFPSATPAPTWGSIKGAYRQRAEEP